MAGSVHIGISGWSYYDWKGVFYPEDLKSTDWLSYYAKYFGLTEINSSFYHLPREKTVLGWTEKVPSKFLFCPKMTKYLTHISKLKDPDEPLARFFEVFDLIKKQLGPVLIQLPPSLKYDETLVRHFFEALKRDYSEYSFALEARNSSWIEPAAFALMKKYKVAWVISQSGVGFPYSEQVTAKNIYIRFHGPGKLYASSYPNEMLQEYADKIAAWKDAGHSIWVFFNNCYNGVAIDNANTLKKMLWIK